MSSEPGVPPISWQPPDQGVLFVVSGPSGVGKSTLLKAAMAAIPGLEFSVSTTTRAPREGEEEGVHYHFVSAEEFAERVAKGAFLEHALVYDRYYGTSREQVEAALAQGRSILLDIDVLGARQVRQRMPEAVHIFILPTHIDVLEQRLRARGEPEATIRRRMAQAAGQLLWSPTYDYVVVNDDLETAKAVLQGILLAEMSRTRRRASALDRVFSTARPPA